MGTEAAVKVIRKGRLTKEDLAALEVECEAMRKLGGHPNFVRMFAHFEEREFFFIVLELVSGGELFERIVEKERYSERDARNVMMQMVKAIKYANEKLIVHRDLKPENILLKSKTDDTAIKARGGARAGGRQCGGVVAACGGVVGCVCSPPSPNQSSSEHPLLAPSKPAGG